MEEMIKERQEKEPEEKNEEEMEEAIKESEEEKEPVETDLLLPSPHAGGRGDGGDGRRYQRRRGAGLPAGGALTYVDQLTGTTSPSNQTKLLGFLMVKK